MAANAKETSRRCLIIMTVLGGLLLDHMATAMYWKFIKVERQLSLESAADSVKEQEPIYVVIVDAGTLGSRLHTFKFHRDPLGGDYVLDNGNVTHAHPGLSAYADEPEKAADSLAGLLATAKKIIPMSEWAKTPFSLKATAGLRLLPKEKADKILEKCSKLIRESGFLVTEDSVSIMEESDEGLYGWLSLNFLTDRFSSNASGTTFAALDLGGGSTEVTFATNNANFPLLANHTRTLDAFGRNISVYTNSYLGMGLMVALKKILTRDVDREILKTQNTIEIHSECISPNISTELNDHHQKYIIKASLEPSLAVDRFAECQKIMYHYIAKIEKKEKPIGLQEHEVYAFSGYIQVAAEAGLIDPNKGGVTTVGAFEKAAKTACQIPNKKQPFMCLVLTYISVLLQKGFGFEPDAKLHLYKYLRGHELSWALGAAFELLPK